MNKEQLLKLVDSLELPKEKYYILSSGSLLLYELRDFAKNKTENLVHGSDSIESAKAEITRFFG